MTRKFAVSDSDIIRICHENTDKTAWVISRSIHVGMNRLERLVNDHGIQLAKKRMSPKAGKIIWDKMNYARKLCPHCDEWKGVEYFYESSTSANGYDSWCIKCQLDKRKRPH